MVKHLGKSELESCRCRHGQMGRCRFSVKTAFYIYGCLWHGRGISTGSWPKNSAIFFQICLTSPNQYRGTLPLITFAGTILLLSLSLTMYWWIWLAFNIYSDWVILSMFIYHFNYRQKGNEVKEIQNWQSQLSLEYNFHFLSPVVPWMDQCLLSYQKYSVVFWVMATKRLFPHFQFVFWRGQCPATLDKHWKELFAKTVEQDCIVRLKESILPLPLSVLPLGLLPTPGVCEVWSCVTPAEWFPKKEAPLFTSHFQTFAGISDLTQRLCRKRLCLLWRYYFLVLWAPYDVWYVAKYCTF